MDPAACRAWSTRTAHPRVVRAACHGQGPGLFADGGAAAAKPLQLLSRASLVNGELDLWGERVFTDTRVRKALSQLAADPPRGFLNAIEQAVGTPAVPRELKESLARVFDSQIGAVRESAAATDASKPKPPSASPAPGTTRVFSRSPPRRKVGSDR